MFGPPGDVLEVQVVPEDYGEPLTSGPLPVLFRPKTLLLDWNEPFSLWRCGWKGGKKEVDVDERKRMAL